MVRTADDVTVRTARKRRVRKRRYNRRNVVRNQVALSKRVRKLETMPELKYHDIELDQSDLRSSNTFPLVEIPMEDDVSRPDVRMGNKVVLRSYNYRVIFRNTSLESKVVRWLIVQDKQPNNAVALTSTILTDTDTGDSVTSPISMSYRRRFKVIEDIYVTLQPTAIYTAAGDVLTSNKPVQVMKGYKKKRMTITYLTSPINDQPTTNSLLLLVITGNTEASVLTMSAHIRMRFNDS